MRAVIGLAAGLAMAATAGACSSGAEDAGASPLTGDPRARSKPEEKIEDFADSAGQIESYSTSSFATGTTNGFFANLGTNGRVCGTCHVQAEGWTISTAGVRARASNDPIFTPNDGSDCPPTTAGQGADSARSSMLLDYGVIRIQIGIPSGSNFSLLTATNPEGCDVAPASNDAKGQLFMFRRPLPSTNLVFDTTIMFDGRETLQPIATTINEQNETALLFDLADQANGATTGHAQGASIVGTQAQTDIVFFEMSLSTAQSKIVTPKGNIVKLDVQGGNGGPTYIAKVLAPAFFVGVNDPLGSSGFTNQNFTIFSAWEPTSPGYAKLQPAQQAIGRGEAIFNDTTFTIHDVPGINSAPTNPLYNSKDPLAGQNIVAGCALCHNNPNIGNHSTSLPINIGITMAAPVNNDGSANDTLDIARLPVYTLQGPGGATVVVTDPGRALISGHWTDVGKTKGPILRGLASRAPYFHNGSAKDLTTVVKFYDERFHIGFTDAQVSDLVAFLNAL